MRQATSFPHTDGLAAEGDFAGLVDRVGDAGFVRVARAGVDGSALLVQIGDDGAKIRRSWGVEGGGGG